MAEPTKKPRYPYSELSKRRFIAVITGAIAVLSWDNGSYMGPAIFGPISVYFMIEYIRIGSNHYRECQEYEKKQKNSQSG